MKQVAGIKIEKDAKGFPRYARIDLRKHGKELEPFLNSAGAIIDIDLSKYLTGNELITEMEPIIDEIFAQK